jgi:hypothetical protein
LLSLAVATLASPAYAYDDCGAPPEPPALPRDPAPATEAFVRELQQYDHDFAVDVEGHLICLQLAESDVNADASMAPAAKARLIARFQDAAAQARGLRSRWVDDFNRWLEAWSRAHGRPVPPPVEGLGD